MINAIPTKLVGIQFRSRLEAKWAAFFDLLGWPWEYEPIDLDGYIPDFVLMFKTPMLVEIKPALSITECLDASQKIKESAFAWLTGVAGKPCRTYEAWIERRRQAVVFGAAVMDDDDVHSKCIGLLSDSGWSGKHWADAQIAKCRCGYTVTSSRGYWGCSRGCVDHQPGRGASEGLDADLIPLWREAGNRVQWRGTGAR